ncbi:MAG TPA: DM13 domain-containing protein [Candidatus Limnocylindrales bacterium]
MELLGDLERAFAAAIYPNRLLVGFALVGLVAALFLVGRRRHWAAVARQHPRRTLGALLIAAAVAVPLGWYLGSPLFLSSTVDEPPPIVVDDASPSPRVASPSPDRGSARASVPPSPSPFVASPPAPIERSGSFRGADEFHFGRGTARLIETAPGMFTIRLEDFAVRNGPDLFVYLSPSAEGYTRSAVELGRLKADRGNQNYLVPVETNAKAARSVVIWCRQFSVQFAVARLD